MTFKIIALCFSAVLIQITSAQCIGNNVASLAGPAYGFTGNGFAGKGFLPPAGDLGCSGPNPGLPTSGGSFIVTSSSPIAPTGLQVLAENLLIEGPLEVMGTLPMLGAVEVEGLLPCAGQASTMYGCGNGDVEILSEIGGASGFGAPSYGATQLGAAQQNAAQFNAAHLGAAQFNSAQQNAAQINAAQREAAAHFNAAQLEAAQLEAAQLGAAHLSQARCNRIL